MRTVCREVFSGNSSEVHLEYFYLILESLGDCSFLNTCFHMDTCKVSCGQIQQKIMHVPGLWGCAPLLRNFGSFLKIHAPYIKVTFWMNSIFCLNFIIRSSI